MTIWYISTTGSDTTGDGSSGNPYLTVSKCLTVGIDGDTVRALTGTYTITSTTNIDKQFTIISDSGVATDVIFDSNTTIFNIQNSNVSITYVTLQTSNTTELVTIDRMSTGTTVPTFWTGINISNCNVKYVTNALSLNGTFTVNNNTFTRSTGTNIADLIKVYSTRGTCSINSNSFTDTQSVQYIIYLTSIGSGTYLDMCNSKGGTLNINSNIVNFTNDIQFSTFIYQDYFNQYIYVTDPSEQYNINTKLSITASNNSITTKTLFNFFNLLISNNNDFSMYYVNNITSNNVNCTDRGILHLDKQMNDTSILIDYSDLNRNVFKIYNNILDTIFPTYSLIHLDMSTLSSFANNTEINTWPNNVKNNLSAIGYKFGTFTHKPLYINTEPYPYIQVGTSLAGVGNGNYFKFPNVILNNEGITVIVCARFKRIANWERLFEFGGAGSFVVFLNRYATTSNLDQVFTTAWIRRNATIVTDTWQIFAVSFSNLKFLYYNNNQIISDNISTNVFNTTITVTSPIFAGSASEPYSYIDVRELVVLNRFTDVSDLTNVVNTMKAKYNM